MEDSAMEDSAMQDSAMQDSAMQDSAMQDSAMEDSAVTSKVITTRREIAAGPGRIFELIADPSLQPDWDGNDNLAEAPTGQRVRGAGEVFTMKLTQGSIRQNRVVEFLEGRCIAWLPSEPGQAPPGHLWRWELEPVDEVRTRVTHTYDWSGLTDENRFARARATTPDKLKASLDRLAALAETLNPNSRESGISSG